MKRALACVTTLLMLMAAAQATTVKPMTVERLTRASEMVVRAQADESWTEWNDTRTLLYTYTRFRVIEAWKGDAESTVVVKQIGGSKDGYIQKAAGVRHWSKGEQSVLFLNRSKESPDRMVVTGLMQGDFRVRRSSNGERVSNGVAGVEQMQRGQVVEYRGATLSLRELQDRVKRAVSQ